MNDNVDENFLRNLLQKCGPTEEQIIYRHPRTQRRLGIARIVFVDVRSARSCIEKYNQQSVMGNVMNVFHDAFGEQCKQILREASGEKKPQKPIIQAQPPVNPPINQQIPPMPTISTFKPKDELLAPHVNESEPYYHVDYSNPYGRSGHIVNDHKQEENDWNDSRDKYDEYGYEADDHRHYRYEKKDSRRWESKPSRYYKTEKDRDRRTDRRDYRSHRDDRDRDSSRRRDYDYDRKDRDTRDRRERDSRSRESKYRDYKKSDRDYAPSADSSFSYSSSTYTMSSHHHSSHHYSSFDSSTSSFHQYPPLP